MLHIEWITDSTLTELFLVGLAFVLSALIGVERHRQLKSAGIRTHTLVGVGSAVFTLVSSYGFAATIGADVVLDPSRIAAQIVSGIGFLGAGVIFVRQNAVSGLTTAASIWGTAAIGMACGAGMPVLAVTATLLHFGAVVLLARVGRRIPAARSGRVVIVQYNDGRGVLRSILATSTEMGFEAMLLGTRRIEPSDSVPRIQANMRFTRGNTPMNTLIERISDIQGVQFIRSSDRDDPDEG